MTSKENKRRKKTDRFILLFCFVIVIFSMLVACGPSTEELESVDYTPVSADRWHISTPAEQDLDPDLVAELYYNASQLETIYSLLVFKNGYLIAEDYFNNGSADRQVNIHSVTKSITSALMGIALEEGCITSIDQKMMEFFPELAGRIKDPRKNEIAIRQLLQMRAGYPWEESTAELFDLLYSGFRNTTLVDVPLVRDPGSDSEYSNLTSHIIGIIVARVLIRTFSHLPRNTCFLPLGSNQISGKWIGMEIISAFQI